MAVCDRSLLCDRPDFEKRCDRRALQHRQWVEKSVEQITDRILAQLGKPESLKTYVPDRPGHDRRYLLNSSKIRRELGWQPEVDFEEGMQLTIDWYREHEEWWRPLQKRLAVAEASWQ